MTSAPIILMTGTIAPPAKAVNLAIVDAGSRIADYKAALRRYIDLLRSGAFSRIVFVENSGYGMEDFKSLLHETGVSDRVELLSFKGNKGAETYERLFLECEILDYAFAHAVALQSRDRTRVWKVTGRYFVKNLPQLQRSLPASVDFGIHCRNRPVKFVDFAVLAMTTDCGPSVISTIRNCERVKMQGEKAVRELYDQGAFDAWTTVPRLPHVPDYSGRRGVDGASYDGFRYRAKHAVRAVVNRMMPALWI